MNYGQMNGGHMGSQVDVIRAFHWGARFIVEMEVVMPETMTVRESHDIALKLQHKVGFLLPLPANAVILTAIPNVLPLQPRCSYAPTSLYLPANLGVLTQPQCTYPPTSVYLANLCVLTCQPHCSTHLKQRGNNKV
jgi:Dimerisation domain of Zinc Transporter